MSALEGVVAAVNAPAKLGGPAPSRTAISAILRIREALKRSTLSAEGPAVDTARVQVSNGRGGHGRHGRTTVVPSFAELPLAVRLEQHVEAMAQYLARLVELEVDGGTPAQAKKAEDEAVLASEGISPFDLAAIYRRNTESIRKLRERHGRDPDTGERVPPVRTITAPARTAADGHYERRRAAAENLSDTR